MSETDKDKNQTPATGNDKKDEKGLHITIDDVAMKTMAESNAKLEGEKKAAEEKAAKEEAAKKVAEEQLKIKTEEAEDLKGKMGMIAEKELEKKRNAIKESAKRLFPNDESRVKEIEAKLKDPDGIQAMEYTLGVLDETLKKGQEEAKKAHEAELAAKAKEEADKLAAEEAVKAGKTPAPTGSAPLNDLQMGKQPQSSELSKMKFDSHKAMVDYLREQEHSSDPQKAAEAKAVLDEFFRRWTSVVKDNYEQTRQSVPTGDQPTLKELTLSRQAKEARKQLEGQ